MRGLASRRRAASSASGIRGERVAAGDPAQRDAPPSSVELRLELVERRGDRLLLHLDRLGELGRRDRFGREEEQRLDRSGKVRRRSLRVHLDPPEGLLLRPGRLAAAVELEQGEQRHRLGEAVLVAEGLVEVERLAGARADPGPRRAAAASVTVVRMCRVSGWGGIVSRSPSATPTRSGS